MRIPRRYVVTSLGSRGTEQHDVLAWTAEDAAYQTDLEFQAMSGGSAFVRPKVIRVEPKVENALEEMGAAIAFMSRHSDREERRTLCQHPEHEPPIKSLAPGNYLYRCPGCGTGGEFTVEPSSVFEPPKDLNA